jgi:predicted acetyltransferase
MQIVQLTHGHESALCDFLEDFARAGETEIPAYFGEASWSHAEIVEHLAAWARGERLPAGWVPCTTSMLEEDGELLGVVNLRHELTDALRRCGGHVGYSVRPSARSQGHAARLLEAAKEQARALGLERILVTCDTDNLASARVIQKCGGEVDDVIEGPAGRRTKRFWIAL